ncbi:hypothetical protein JCM8547_000369 [Rhodosporidiobolus lusitaniae]
MYRPPNSGASHGRSPSADGDFRRASTHSIGVSYAYGAPASPRTSVSGKLQTSPGRAKSAVSGSGSTRNGEEAIQEDEGEGDVSGEQQDSGRASEPASVRYGRIAQRKKDTGETYPPPSGNTSVNIANAFKAATSGAGGIKTGGRREDFPPLNGNGEAEAEEDDLEYVDERPVKEAVAPASTGKKRKKHAVRDATYRHRPGETSSSEESEYDQSRGKQKKRTKVGSEGDDLAEDDTAANKPRRRSHKPADPSYNPRRDPNFHDGQTSTSESDGGESVKTHRRRKSKGKGRASVGGTSAASMAIPRGIKDGEVWYGKKRKGRKGTRKSTANGDEEDEEGEEDDEEQYGGGMDQQDEYENAEDDRDATPPAHSFYLRPKSPTPQPSPGSTNGQPQRNGWSLSPFRFGGRSAAQDAPPVDPAFNAFDRSLNGGDNSNSLSVSFEDSAIRGSSYDFSEEEAIVRLLEEQNASKQQQQQNPRLNPSPPSPPSQLRQAQEQQQRQAPPTPGPSTQQQRAAPAATPNLRHLQQQQQQAPSPNPSLAATPVPYTGAYPQTPAQAGANGASGSPVSAMRRRNGKGVPVPSMLGAGTKLAPPLDDDGEEDEDGVRRRRGGLGEKLGTAFKPVLDAAGRAWQKTQDPLLDWVKIWKAVFVVLLTLFILLVYFSPPATEAPVPSTAPPPPSPSTFFDYLPFFRSSKPSSAYVPPDVPADSLEGLIARLSRLEFAVGRISSSSESDRQQHSQDRQAVDTLSTQLDVLHSTLRAEQERARVAIEAAEKSSAKEAAQVGRAVEAVKGELESLVSRVKTLSNTRDADTSELKKLQGSVNGVGRDIVALNAQVEKVAKDLDAATDLDRLTKIAVDAIGKKLPGKMAARVDESGRLDIDPAFWRVLKDAFADKKAVESKLKAIELPKGGLFGGSKDVKAPPAAPAVPPSWDDFLASNEESLKAWVEADLTSRTGSDAFISKQQFLDLLRREIKSLKRDFEAKANENFEQMGQEILGKVAKQEELRRKDSLASHLNPFHRHGQAAPVAASGPVTIKSADGQNVTAIISSLVDSALVRYSKDVLARPDYALYTAGGRVIRSLTSPTYEPHPLGAFRSALAWVTGTTAPRGRPPVTALHYDTSPGSCWPFAGQYGQLGIQLSRRVVPSDITIEHISSDVALDGDVSSAPKDFEVWGVVEGEQDVVKLVQYRQQQLEAKRAARAAGESSLEDDLNNPGGEPASLPPSANHLLLATGSYDPSAPSPVQSFPVTAMARQLGIPVNVVVVKVLSNHGESAYTCLYRVRVSGTTEAQVAAESPVDA